MALVAAAEPHVHVHLHSRERLRAMRGPVRAGIGSCMIRPEEAFSCMFSGVTVNFPADKSVHTNGWGM